MFAPTVISICNRHSATSKIHFVFSIFYFEISTYTSTSTFLTIGPRSASMYVPALMYLYVLSIKHISLDIRIPHAPMYQIG